jgi:putative endonuclease
MAWVYVLKSRRGDRYYVGGTIDLKSRLLHHKGGHTPSTKRFGEVDLVLSQQFDSLNEARVVEKKIKLLKRKDYIKKMVIDGYIKLGR